MDLLFLILQLVGISLGAGAAFIFDCFFIISLKNHRISVREEKILSRLSLLSIIASTVAIFSYIIVLSFQFEENSISATGIGFATAKLLIFSFALLCGITLRKIHLPALLRHQQTYFHLSESMLLHQDSLISTAIYSTVSWLAVLTLTAIEQKQAIYSVSLTQYNFLHIIVIYIAVAITCNYVGLLIKNKVL